MIPAAEWLMAAKDPIARFICTVCIRVGSGDPVTVLHLFHNKYTGYNWSIYCLDYVQLVTTESNVLLYLLPMSMQLFCWASTAEWLTYSNAAVLYCTVPYIAACVDISWNGIFWDRSHSSFLWNLKFAKFCLIYTLLCIN